MVFNDQIGIDDMLVKSKVKKDHVARLEETFRTMKKYQIELRLIKDAFKSEFDKFLNFMVN